ncbi:hypothetical protein F441_21401 [Phytophthora nicotianae CJ01A1]|uniref:Uncharacterized protein n=4 Tax=Phytophthora nicotianae TaxID=4792 RepID=W2VSN0_PHYNI|nr:hypothetical protein F441_21401 [Phytophthora nicotianae CJ01A1]
MRGRKRFPPDKPVYEDEIVAETPPSPTYSQPPKRLKRQDVADRIDKNKAADFFVMKKTLKSFCKPEAERLVWDECIPEVNHAIAEAYLLANYYALSQLKAGRPLYKIDTPFYQLCLSLVTSVPRRPKYEKFLATQATKDKRKLWIDSGKVGKLKDFPATVPEFSETGYQEWLKTQKVKNADLENANDEFGKMRGDRAQTKTEHLNQGWFQAAAKKMATNAKNSVVWNFAKRLLTYVIKHYGLKRAAAHEALNKTFATEEFNSTYVRVVEPVITELRKKIPRTKDGKISWVPHDLLPMFYEFVEEYDEENMGKMDFVEKPTFSLLPTKRGFEASYCKVDSTGLKSLLKRSPKVAVVSGLFMTDRCGHCKTA